MPGTHVLHSGVEYAWGILHTATTGWRAALCFLQRISAGIGVSFCELCVKNILSCMTKRFIRSFISWILCHAFDVYVVWESSFYSARCSLSHCTRSGVS